MMVISGDRAYTYSYEPLKYETKDYYIIFTNKIIILTFEICARYSEVLS